jgi:hypothetical protein
MPGGRDRSPSRRSELQQDGPPRGACSDAERKGRAPAERPTDMVVGEPDGSWRACAQRYKGRRAVMAIVGCFLSSEEHGPESPLRTAGQAEEAGFPGVLISDHYHPWINRQGESPFVWSVVGAIAGTTQLRVTTGVTCPTVRIHPAVLAQAAATSQLLLQGRFSFGVGSGEALTNRSSATGGLRRTYASRCSKRRWA